MVFLRFPFKSDLKLLNYENNMVNAGLLKRDIASCLGYDQFTLLYNGRPLLGTDFIPNEFSVQIVFPLPGGKGGFGSMLRAIGAQIEKTTNREACRDLSGRRLRDINEEQRLKKWIAKEAEREAEKVRRRKERIERLKNKPPHKFFDFEYEKEISELPTRIDDALSEGLQKSKQPTKRPLEKSEKPLKKTWLADDSPVSSSGSELEETDSEINTSPIKKPKIMELDNTSDDTDTFDSLQCHPGSSKDSNYDFDESSTSSYSKSKSTDTAENTMEVSIVDAMPEFHKTDVSQSMESEMENNLKDATGVEESHEKNVAIQSKSDDISAKKEPEGKDDSPVDLLHFQSASELEALGLDILKSALIARGLKCGGTLSDRAQRLWKVRSLEPHEYPANLLAKNKK